LDFSIDCVPLNAGQLRTGAAVRFLQVCDVDKIKLEAKRLAGGIKDRSDFKPVARGQRINFRSRFAGLLLQSADHAERTAGLNDGIELRQLLDAGENILFCPYGQLRRRCRINASLSTIGGEQRLALNDTHVDVLLNQAGTKMGDHRLNKYIGNVILQRLNKGF
jgi:hypothetical protein